MKKCQKRKNNLKPSKPDESGILVENLSVCLDGADIVGPIDLVIVRHAITSLIGANGAGKSTLLRTVGRLIAPNAGSVKVAGYDVHTTDSRVLAKVIAVLQQETSTGSRLTVRELVSLGRFPYSRGNLNSADNEFVTASMNFLSLLPLAGRPLEQLSGGQRRRAFIAMVLAQDTDFVLLDEPLAGLDMGHAVKLMQQVRAASRELGKTVVWVEHDVNMAAAYADRIVALAAGCIAFEGSPREVMISEKLESLYDTPVFVIENQGKFFADFYSNEA